MTATPVDDDQWPESDSDTFLGECEWCGERRPLQRRADPMVAEGVIDGDREEMHDVCRRCWERRADDI